MKKIYIYLLLLFSLNLFSNSAKAQYLFTTNTLEYSGCDSLFYRLGINTYLSGTSYDSILVYSSFGDGSVSSVQALSGTPRAYVGHNYSMPGVYTVKSYLVYNGAVEDSVVFEDTVNLCTSMHVISYIDHNNNCVYDAGDSYLPNPYTLEIDSAGIPVDTITSTSFYYAGGSAGTVYAFRILTMPSGYVLSCPGDSVVYDTVMSTTPNNWYASFGFTCDSSSFDLHVWGWFSAGLTGACSHVYAYEYGCASVPNASLTINYSTLYAYSSNSAGYTPSASGAGWVTFNLGTLAPDSVASFNVFFTAAGSPAYGDTVHTTWTLDPIAGDSNPANNVHSEVDSVHTSYDPNEKSVSPQGNIAAGTALQYAIGFENTGTASAMNIHIQDTLSADLNINTFRLISASAAVTTEIASMADGRSVVKFDFANIDLLDAANPGKNTGMVLFSINTKTGLPIGTVINNNASIYFDYNAPVMTNTTQNIIGTPAGLSILTNSTDVNIYPNPAGTMLNVAVINGNYNNAIIQNSIGQTIIKQTVSSKTFAVDVSKLSTGVYYFTLTGDNGRMVKKFVKE